MNILLLSNVSHLDTPTSQIQIARALALRHSILYVDTLGNRRAGPGRRDVRKLRRRLAAGLRGPVRLGPGLVAVSPLVPPGPASDASPAVDRLVLVPQIRRALRSAGMGKPDVLWIASPSGARLLDAYRDVPVVYYCTDDTSAFPAVDAESVLEDERRVLERASAVISVSEALATRLRMRGVDHVEVLENGVDVGLFQDPPTGALRAADEFLSGIQGPIALLAGVIDDRTDVALLGAVAGALPNVTFVVAGPLMPSFTGALPALPNIRHLGSQPHETIAGLVARSDACVAPYADTPIVRTSSPLKVLEYLAAGKPVVTTDVLPLRPLRAVLSIAEDERAFADALSRALAPRGDGEREARRAVARARSWGHVAQVAESIIEQVLTRGGDRWQTDSESSSSTII